MNKDDDKEKKQTPEQMLRAMQGIFCKGRYKPFDLVQEEIRIKQRFEKMRKDDQEKKTESSKKNKKP